MGSGQGNFIEELFVTDISECGIRCNNLEECLAFTAQEPDDEEVELYCEDNICIECNLKSGYTLVLAEEKNTYVKPLDYDDIYMEGYETGATSGDLNLDGVNDVLDAVMLIDIIINP